MKIKPYIVLGLATACAASGLVIIIAGSDPYTAEPRMVWLFWASLLFSVWGLISMLFSLAGQRLAFALTNGLFWATGIVSLGTLARQGIASKRLAVAIIGFVILLSFVFWWRARRRMESNE